MKNKKTKSIIELFAGIGGLAQGFADSGKFHLQGLLDIDPIARESFGLNFPEIYYEEGDIRQIDPFVFLERTNAGRPFAVLGCPPCQGLSSAGKRNPKDPHN